MPLDIRVGPPVLTINHGSTFMVTDLRGEIAPDSEQGVFAHDTRFLSHYAILANGRPWVLQSSSPTGYDTVRIHLSNPFFKTVDGDVLARTLSLTLLRAAGDGIHEDIYITSYAQSFVRFNLELELRSDFADLFEVKNRDFVRRGQIVERWDATSGTLETAYSNREFERRFIFRIAKSDSPVARANGRLRFELSLDPHGSWHACCQYELVASKHHRPRARTCAMDGDENSDFVRPHRRWIRQSTTLTSANEDVNRLYRQSIDDMAALRLYDHDLADDVWIPAAGVPWFVTIFGRDSLIASLQNMISNCSFAVGTLRKLAEYQAKEVDDWRDAEPGKIPHEIRFGELAHFHRIPHTPYYGTADATPLYLIVLHETWKWTGDVSLLEEQKTTALNCLEWIDRYGDIDGDGFQEYRTRSEQGYENMGWKDSFDAVVYPDGKVVKQPKALCELQGYVFDAWCRAAEVFEALGDSERSRLLRRKAAELKKRFDEAFWCDDLGFYAFALDAEKKPVKTVASNQGHLLWSGIAPLERARRVVRRFLAPDLWSGWGIRTLSANNAAYDPFAYQRGSVWPHDNGIIALGFARYGFAAEAAAVARDVFAAAAYFAGYRLPELYAGLSRKPGAFPVQYVGANVPQAWAAGSVFHLLQAILGIRGDAPNGRLYVDPALPEWLPRLSLGGLKIGRARVDLRFWREAEATRWDASVREGTIEVLHGSQIGN